MKLTNEEKNIIDRLINNELEYYDQKEDYDELDKDFVLKLKKILIKLKGEK